MCPLTTPRPLQTLQGRGVQPVRLRAQRIAFALDNMDDDADA